MAVIASKCPEITINVVDVDVIKIKKWNSNNLPVYEPGLKEIVSEFRGKNLFFSTDVENGIRNAEMIFIAVGTPTKNFGKGKGQAADLKYVELCARSISKYANSDKIIIEKSTLPVRTADSIKRILKSNRNNVHFEVLSNPEFLAEGTAIEDLLNADRILIGSENSESGKKACQALSWVYEHWLEKSKILTTNVWSSELSKLVANAFLAQRVSSINSISALCEKTDADVGEVAKAIGMDSRIGSKFLKSSVGFGGSCFQKDILNLVYISKYYGLIEVADYWEQVILMNNFQKSRFSENVVDTLYKTVSGKKITIYGWAFKKDTNDTRESASMYIATDLLEEGANISVYDPKVSKNQIMKDLENVIGRDFDRYKNLVNVETNHISAIENSHAVLVLTDWDEFLNYDWEKIYESMDDHFIFDGRRILDKKMLENFGFNVYRLGTK